MPVKPRMSENRIVSSALFGLSYLSGSSSIFSTTSGGTYSRKRPASRRLERDAGVDIGDRSRAHVLQRGRRGADDGDLALQRAGRDAVGGHVGERYIAKARASAVGNQRRRRGV